MYIQLNLLLNYTQITGYNYGKQENVYMNIEQTNFEINIVMLPSVYGYCMFAL